MQSRNQLLFDRSSAKLIFGSAGKPPFQRVEIDVENENPIKQINKAGEISGAAAEEGDCVAVISDHGFDFVHIPKLMLLLPYDLVHLALMGRFIHRFPRLWIAPINQLPVTVEDVVTAPLQFFSHRGLAGARHAFDQIVSDAHPFTLTRNVRVVGQRNNPRDPQWFAIPPAPAGLFVFGLEDLLCPAAGTNL